MILLFFGMVACRKPAVETAPPLVQQSMVEPIPTGRIVDGVYTDANYPFTLPLPPGWTGRPGYDGDVARVTLTSPDGYAKVTVVAVPGEDLTPRVISGCTWTFTDRARYRALKVVGDVTIATCTPDDTSQGRVLAYILTNEGVTWHIEGTLAGGHLPEAKTELDTIAGAIRFR